MTLTESGAPVATSRQRADNLFPLEIAFADYDRTRPIVDDTSGP